MKAFAFGDDYERLCSFNHRFLRSYVSDRIKPFVDEFIETF